jgi:hypothetical protein
VVVAVAAPAAVVLLWGRFAAPNSSRRLATAARVPFEVGVFALAVAGLVAAGAPVPAGILAGLVLLNCVLLTLFDQWDG